MPPLSVATDPGWVSPGAAGPTTIHPGVWVPPYGGPVDDVAIDDAGWYSVPTLVDDTSPGYYIPGFEGLTTCPPAGWEPPYVGDPAAVLVRAATPAGVIVDDSIYARGARCITLVPVPADIGGLVPYSSAPFMIIGGWQGSGILSGLYQKRFLSDGALDVGRSGVGEDFPYPGYGLSTGASTELIAWGGTRNVVHSIGNDGTSTYALLSMMAAGEPGTIFGMSYWIVEKRSMMGYVPVTYPVGGTVTGGSPGAEPHYALGIYGPVPYAEFENDFSCSSLTMDAANKRFFITGCGTGTLGGELWHLEKRKTKTIVLDALFNTSGDRPGMLEEDPEPGQNAVPKQWFVYSGYTGASYWSTVDPDTDSDPYTYFYPVAYGYPPSTYPSYIREGTPAIAGRPDRCRAATIHLDKIYVVGSDCSDEPTYPEDPGHYGEWRIECRNK